MPLPLPSAVTAILPTEAGLDQNLAPDSNEPFRHPDCCLSLSAKLLTILRSELQLHPQPSNSASNPATSILSIGSGSGLLERALQASSAATSDPAAGASRRQSSEQDAALDHAQPTDDLGFERARLDVRGVEVAASVNKYLAAESVVVVKGSWELAAQEADEATVLMFVYPRQTQLVERYLSRVATRSNMASARVRAVVWLGPVVDWEGGGFGEVVEAWAAEEGWVVEERRGGDMGLLREEMGVVVKLREGREV